VSANPRWLGTVPVRPDEARIAELTQAVGAADDLVRLTQYPEWVAFAALARDQERDATKGLASNSSTMEDIIAFRAKLRICLWLQELPDIARRDLDNLSAQLQELQAQKEE
jgi:hypothetical protein